MADGKQRQLALNAKLQFRQLFWFFFQLIGCLPEVLANQMYAVNPTEIIETACRSVRLKDLSQEGNLYFIKFPALSCFRISKASKQYLPQWSAFVSLTLPAQGQRKLQHSFSLPLCCWGNVCHEIQPWQEKQKYFRTSQAKLNM